VENSLFLALLGLKKGTAIPLQAWSGPVGSRKVRFPDYMTRAQDDGKVVSLTHRPPLPPGNTPGTHSCFSPEWPSGFQEVKVPRLHDKGTGWW